MAPWRSTYHTSTGVADDVVGGVEERVDDNIPAAVVQDEDVNNSQESLGDDDDGSVGCGCGGPRTARPPIMDHGGKGEELGGERR